VLWRRSSLSNKKGKALLFHHGGRLARKRTPPAPSSGWMAVLSVNLLIVGAGHLAGQKYHETGRGKGPTFLARIVE
jgi:hypothetical protein